LAELEAGEAIGRFLQGLSATDRRIIDLHYFHGLTFARVALILERTEEAVKKRCGRAMARARCDLSAAEHERCRGYSLSRCNFLD